MARRTYAFSAKYITQPPKEQLPEKDAGWGSDFDPNFLAGAE